GRRPGRIQIATLPELAVDSLVGDHALDELIAVHRFAEQRPARVLAVALDELVGAPLVARVDDPAVARRAPESEILGLEERHLCPSAGQHAGGVDPRVPA